MNAQSEPHSKPQLNYPKAKTLLVILGLIVAVTIIIAGSPITITLAE